jgi:hypothetical protein
MLDRAGVVALLQDVIGLSKTRLNIPNLDLAAFAAVIAIVVLSVVLVDQRGACL